MPVPIDQAAANKTIARMEAAATFVAIAVVTDFTGRSGAKKGVAF